MKGLEIPAVVDAVVPQTFLADVPPDVARRVLEGGRTIELRIGATVPPRSRKPGVAIIVEGLVRVYLVSPQARQVTVRYARRGETLGLVQLFGRSLVVHVQAVTSTLLWTLPAKRLREAARESAPLAAAIAEECAVLVVDAVEELALLTFGTIRQRVARHLLDLAANEPRKGDLVAAVTHQELADATGSVREVVARALKELHAAGLTARSSKGIVILDAAGLDADGRASVPGR